MADGGLNTFLCYDIESDQELTRFTIITASSVLLRVFVCLICCLFTSVNVCTWSP